MSKLYYEFTIEEVEIDEEWNPVRRIETDIPHHDQIKAYLPKEWDKCEIHTTFDGILKNKVQQTKLTIRKKDGKTIGRVTIEFIPGLRLNEKIRNACWEQMDGQMTDGFGESYSFSKIPGVDEKYRMEI